MFYSISLWIKKKKKRQTAWPGNTRENYTLQSTQIHASKKILLFIPIKVQSITISSAIPYVSEMNSTSNSLKKKSQERVREREREEERVRKRRKRRRKKRKRRRESDNGKEKEKENEKKEEKEKEEKEEEEKMEKAVLKVLL